jgi:hypothetical protein
MRQGEKLHGQVAAQLGSKDAQPTPFPATAKSLADEVCGEAKGRVHRIHGENDTLEKQQRESRESTGWTCIPAAEDGHCSTNEDHISDEDQGEQDQQASVIPEAAVCRLKSKIKFTNTDEKTCTHTEILQSTSFLRQHMQQKS